MNGGGLQRALVRCALGVYLYLHYVALLPYAGELFARGGAISERAASPFFGHVPNPLFVWDAPELARWLVVAGALLGLLLACRIQTRAVALASWAVSMWLYQRDPLIGNPALPFVGLLLLVYGVFPERDPDARRPWYRLTSSYGLFFLVLALGYTYSGLTKLVSPSWLDGSALRHVLENPLARPNALRALLLAAPPALLQAMSYAVLALEVCFAPLCLWRRSRAPAWTVMVAMHLGILLLVDFADLTAGMLLAHAFTFDPAWVSSLRGARATSAKRAALAAAASR